MKKKKRGEIEWWSQGTLFDGVAKEDLLTRGKFEDQGEGIKWLSPVWGTELVEAGRLLSNTEEPPQICDHFQLWPVGVAMDHSLATQSCSGTGGEQAERWISSGLGQELQDRGARLLEREARKLRVISMTDVRTGHNEMRLGWYDGEWKGDCILVWLKWTWSIA